ncbi:MAG: hypothetical protein U0166_06735 [Acidobacteriota bacterium]
MRHRIVALSLSIVSAASPLAAFVGPGVPGIKQGPSPRLFPETEAVQAALRAEPGYQAFLARYGGTWEVKFDEVFGTPLWIRGSGIGMLPRAASRDQALDAARRFLAENVDLLKAPMSDLRATDVAQVGDVWAVYFERLHDGVPVVSSRIEILFKLGRLVLVKMESYPLLPGASLATVPLLSAPDAAAVASGELSMMPSASDRARLVVLPVVAHDTVALRLAYEVRQDRPAGAGTLPRSYVSYVDARTGAVLEIQDALHYQFSGHLESQVDQRSPGDPIVNVPNSANTVTVGTSGGTTDAAGNWTIAGSGTQTLSIGLDGTHLTVSCFLGLCPALSISHSVTSGTPSNDLFSAASEDELAQTDTYRAALATNATALTVYPNETWLLSQVVTATVSIPASCNAFYNANTLNFFASDAQCNNTGRIFDVVGHEYGHGIDDNLPGGLADGGLSEFIGDQMAFVQTDDHRIGPGFFLTGAPVRDLDPSSFPCYDPAITEVHDQGEMLGAVIWDIHEDLQALGFTGQPLTTLLLSPIATSQTRDDWYNGLLVADDDDGNLANGTPHGCVIWNQYDAHSCAATRWPNVPTTPVPCFTASVTDEIVTGSGPGATNPPVGKTWDHAAPPATIASFTPYGGSGYGVNVASADIVSGGNVEVTTGPGPGAVYGPQVRGFNPDGTAIGKVNFFAYGTLKYGAHPGGGDLDGDGHAEILSGPGPGPVFGPHVRGWNYDGVALTAMSKISFFAYGTLKFGVNVAAGKVDGDAFAEIVTGAGAGVVFSPHVRTWNYDNTGVAAGASFFAFATGQYGAKVAAGSTDADPEDEIVAAHGPDPASSGDVKGFDAGPPVASAWTVTAFTTNGGAEVGAGDLDASGQDELLASQAGAANPSIVRAFQINGAGGTQLFEFTAYAGQSFGAKVTAGDAGI